MAHNTPILCYWDIRGLAAPIRLILEYAGVGYENRTMIMPKPEWLQMKLTLGFDFPNLPYYQEGNLKLTQSGAIMRHLARKFKLDGTNEKEKALADMVSDQLGDIRGNLVGLCYNPNFTQQMLQDWAQAEGEFSGRDTLKARLETLERYLENHGGEWFAGENLTFADFMAWEILDQHRILMPGSLDSFSLLKRFMQKFESLENIDSYLHAPRYKQFPIWSHRAKYGYYPLNN